MNPTLTLDVTKIPDTLDVLHLALAGTVLVLLLLWLFTLWWGLFGVSRKLNRLLASGVAPTATPTPAPIPTPEQVRTVKSDRPAPAPVATPAPEPIILKEATPDAALQLLGILQKEARFIDFIQEDILHYSDADVGAAARVVHEGCRKVLREHFSLQPIRSESEGSRVTLPKGFDAASVRLTGNIVGEAPFTGTLVHKGWQVSEVRLPKLTAGHAAHILAPAEVEL